MGFLSSIFGKHDRGKEMEGHAMTGRGHTTMTRTAQVKDAVCGMDVDPATATATSEYMGKTYYFCAAGCKKAFDSDPARYTGNGQHEMTGHSHGGGCC